MKLWFLLVVFFLGVGVSCFNEPRVFREQPRTVPEVVGERVTDARDILADEGFPVLVVSEETAEDVDCPSGEVVSQDPTPSEDVLAGSTVTLVVRGCG